MALFPGVVFPGLPSLPCVSSFRLFLTGLWASRMLDVHFFYGTFSKDFFSCQRGLVFDAPPSLPLLFRLLSFRWWALGIFGVEFCCGTFSGSSFLRSSLSAVSSFHLLPSGSLLQDLRRPVFLWHFFEGLFLVPKGSSSRVSLSSLLLEVVGFKDPRCPFLPWHFFEELSFMATGSSFRWSPFSPFALPSPLLRVVGFRDLRRQFLSWRFFRVQFSQVFPLCCVSLSSLLLGVVGFKDLRRPFLLWHFFEELSFMATGSSFRWSSLSPFTLSVSPPSGGGL